MKKAIYFIFNIILIAGCKKELTPQESSIDFSKTNTTQTNTTSSNSSILNQNNSAITTTSKANPPHGQPGHVCGNENTTQTKTQTPATNNQQYTITPTNTNTTTSSQPKTAKGMNPPHGQPGHRCDIAVGAPLNSKPNKATTPTVVTPNNTGTPALVSTNPTTTQVAPGMNPPHGQPGHVCGIAVGAPLNQDKKTGETTPTETKSEEIKKDN